MRDGFGRTIDYLRLSVTEACNCRCVYCMPAGGRPRSGEGCPLSIAECAEIVRAAASLGVRKVRITGGEPLVRPDIVELCGAVAGVGGIDEVSLTTNATLLAPVAAKLRAAGVRRLNMSLDTLDAGRYRSITRCGTLGDARAGVEAALEAGFDQLKLNCVLMGGVNDDEVVSFVGLARELPLEVRFIELMPMGECASWPRERFISAECVLDVAPELRIIGNSGVAELYGAPGFRGRVGLIRAVSHRFCASCDRIRVTADGCVKPCLHSATEVRIRGLHGDELSGALRRAIELKPAHHNLVPGRRASATSRDMNQIGG